MNYISEYMHEKSGYFVAVKKKKKTVTPLSNYDDSRNFV